MLFGDRIAPGLLDAERDGLRGDRVEILRPESCDRLGREVSGKGFGDLVRTRDMSLFLLQFGGQVSLVDEAMLPS